MRQIVLGRRPADLTLLLPEGGDFVARARFKDGSAWPAGSRLALTVPGEVEWVAVDESSTVRIWNVDKADVAEVLAANRRDTGDYVVRMVFTDGGFDAIWAQGRIG